MQGPWVVINLFSQRVDRFFFYNTLFLNPIELCSWFWFAGFQSLCSNNHFKLVAQSL